MGKSKITVYTDGSYKNGRCGFSFIYKFSNKKLHPKVVYGTCSISSSSASELMAIVKVFRYFKQIGIKDHELEIKSDYLSAVTCLNNRQYNKWKASNWKKANGGNLVRDLEQWATLSSLISDYNVDLIKFTKVTDKGYNFTAHRFARFGLKLLPSDEGAFFTSEISKNPYSYDLCGNICKIITLV